MSLDLYLEFDRDAGSGATAASTVVFPPILAPFTATGTVAATGGWSLLEDGRFNLTARQNQESHPWDPPTRYGIGDTSTVINQLTLSTTCSVAVPMERLTWGALKSWYR